MIGSKVALTNLTSTGPGETDDLTVTVTFQGLSSVVGFIFDAKQRVATAK